MNTPEYHQPSGNLRPYLYGLLVVLLMTPGLLTAQGVTVHAVAAPINVLSIGDVDFVNSSSPQWLFSVDINAGGRSITAVMTVDLKVALATGEVYDPAVHLLTRTFTVNGARTLTNLDIGKGKALRDSVFSKDRQAESKFKEIALPSGQLPAGTYTFAIGVREVAPGNAQGGDLFSIVLTNPSSVELLFPVDRDETVSSFPLFQWVFDGARSRIAVFEQLPGQTSLEESAQGVPQVQVEVSSTSYQYPAAGVRPLQPGKTYVWYVEGHVRAPGGKDMVLRSALRSFRVTRGLAAASTLLDELEQALDPKYKPLFDQIKADGLQVSGAARVNGAALPPADLKSLLLYLRTHPDAVQSAGLE